MEQASSAAEFVRSPVGRWFATRTMIAWVTTPSLGGFATWGRSAVEDVTANVHLFEGLFALPAPVDLLMDGRSIEGIDFDALGALLDWVRTHLPRIRPRIRRRVGVISAGAAGMVLAGISPVLGWTADVSMAPDVASGLRELGAATPEALAAEVDALVAGLRDTPALLVDLRVLLRARRGNLSLAEAARELGVSTRSLQRAVAQAGSSYRTEEFDARLDAALELLRSDAKIASIASRLGVTEGALARLVRQRTGMTPAEYRAAQRAR